MRPIICLQQALEHATNHILTQKQKEKLKETEFFKVYAMFTQNTFSGSNKGINTYTYTLVLSFEAENTWIVYFDGDYAYKINSIHSDMGLFLRDLRAHSLVPPEFGPESYRAYY